MFAWLGSAKNIIIAIITALLGGYVITQKVKAARAEAKLLKLETQIAKKNVIVAVAAAKAKANIKDLEATTEVKIIKDLQKEKKKVIKEMTEIEAQIAETQKEKAEVKGRTKGKKVLIDG